jgi:hypothetical protein
MDVPSTVPEALAPFFLLMLFASWFVFVFGGAYAIWLSIRSLRKYLRASGVPERDESLSKLADAAYYGQKQLYSIWQELDAIRSQLPKSQFAIPAVSPEDIRANAAREVGNYGKTPEVSNSMFGR